MRRPLPRLVGRNMIHAMLIPRRLIVLASLMLLWDLAGLQAHPVAAVDLIEPITSPPGIVQYRPHEPVERSCPIILNRILFNRKNPQTPTIGSRWRLNLFNEKSVIMRLSRVDVPRSGSWTATGDLEGFEGSLAIVAVVDNCMSAIITAPELGRYQIETSGSGRHWLNELDPQAQAICGSNDSISSSSNRFLGPDLISLENNYQGLRRMTATDAPETVIDVMFVYTPATLTGAGGLAGLRSLIDLAIAEGNAVFANSELNVRINLVHDQLIEYEESGSIETDWTRLGNGQGALSAVRSLRDAYGADLVTLIAETDNRGWAGLSRILLNRSGNANHYYSVLTRRWIGAGIHLYIHEIAHSLGCQHDRRNAKNTNGILFPGIFSHSLGYRFTSEEVTHITVMAYPPGIILPFFSNPAAKYAGVPLGQPIGDVDEADNVSTIRRTASLVANYRAKLGHFTFETGELSVWESGAPIDIKVIRHGDLSRASTVSYSAVPGSAREGVDFVPVTGQLIFPPNLSRKNFAFRPVNDRLLEGLEDLTLVLSNPTQGFALTTPASLSVTLLDDEFPLAFVEDDLAVSESSSEAIFRINRFSDSLGGESPATGPIRFDVEIRPEDETSSDVIIEPGSVSFAPDESETTLTIPVVNNQIPETDRVFGVHIGPLVGRLTIIDDDRTGSLDPSFRVALPETVSRVWGLSLVGRDRLIVTGDFEQIEDRARSGMAAIDQNGQLQTDFLPATMAAQQHATPWRTRPLPRVLLVRGNGNLLIGGRLSSLDQEIQPNLAELTSDGSFNPDFRPRIDGVVNAALELEDGRLLIGGRFENVNNTPRQYFTRLLPDGQNDPDFLGKGEIAGFAGQVADFVQQPDGAIIIVGRFETVGGHKHTNVARLTEQGGLDPTFETPFDGVNGPISQVHLLRDSRLIISGQFTRVSGRTAGKIARLLPSGELDTTFDVGDRLDRNVVRSLVLPDGRILIAGEFTHYGPTPRHRIALLQSDGNLDTTFEPGIGADDIILDMALHGEGWLYLAGHFRRVNGVHAPHIARLRIERFLPAITRIEPHGAHPLLQVEGIIGSPFDLGASRDLISWSSRGRYEMASTEMILVPDWEDPTEHQFYRIQAPEDLEFGLAPEP